MQTRNLGSQGLTTSPIGFGSMGITMAYGADDAAGGTAAIRRAHEHGVTLFDTAEMYGWGENERVLGAAVKDFRDEILLATKFGLTPPNYDTDSRPDHIRDVVDNSLRSLQTDHIDVLYQHRFDPKTPIEDVAGTVKELIDAGKVRYFGLSEAGENTVRAAHAVQPVSVLQTEYSLFERDAEQMLPTLRELGIGFVAYSPLGRGFLTGTAKPADQYGEDDMRRTDARWQPGNYEKNLEATRQLAELASSKDATVSQLALAWILAQGEDVVPIPGTRSAARVDENVAASHLHLSSADLHRITEILPTGGFGARYDAQSLPIWH